jgi:hypothetical protein
MITTYIMYCLPQLLSRNVDIYGIQIVNFIEKGEEIRLLTSQKKLTLKSMSQLMENNTVHSVSV